MLTHLNETLKRDPDYLDRLITEIEAADFLGLSVRTLQGWRFKGGGPDFVRVSINRIRYRRRELIAWIEHHVCSNTSQ